MKESIPSSTSDTTHDVHCAPVTGDLQSPNVRANMRLRVLLQSDVIEIRTSDACDLPSVSTLKGRFVSVRRVVLGCIEILQNLVRGIQNPVQQEGQE